MTSRTTVSMVAGWALLGWLSPSAPAQTAAPAGAPATAVAALKSFKDIQQHFDERLESSRKEIETQRLKTLEQFLPAAPEAEREAVLGTLVELALSLEQYDRAVAFSDQFFKHFPKSTDAGDIRKMRLLALMNGDKVKQARTEYEAALAGPKLEELKDLLEAGVLLAEAFADAGEPKEAKGVYELMKQKMPLAVPENERNAVAMQLEQILSPRSDSLDWVGREPPAIEGKDMQGKPVDLKEYKGKVVLIDFWATWCGPCIAAYPDLISLYQKNRDKGFEIIGISLDANGEALKTFLEREKTPWRQVWDNQALPDSQNPFGGPNTRKYNLSAIPATFLIDRDGKIVRAGLSGQALQRLVPRLLARPTTQP